MLQVVVLAVEHQTLSVAEEAGAVRPKNSYLEGTQVLHRWDAAEREPLVA